MFCYIFPTASISFFYLFLQFFLTHSQFQNLFFLLTYSLLLMAIIYQKILKNSKYQLWVNLFFSWFSIGFICFSKPFSNGWSVNVAFSIIYFGLKANFSSPARYLHLWIWFDDRTDTLADSLTILNWNFSSLIWWSIVMIFLYIYFKRFF